MTPSTKQKDLGSQPPVPSGATEVPHAVVDGVTNSYARPVSELYITPVRSQVVFYETVNHLVFVVLPPLGRVLSDSCALCVL